LYKYKYNGKEYQDELGFNMYDYGMMLYDPAIGRRNNIDQKAEQSRRWSPYSYCYNNPIYFVDPDGMQATPPDWFVNNETGTVVYVKGESKITQTIANEVGLGDAKKYDRLGADNMFRDKVNDAYGNNLLDRDAVVIGNSEKFMDKQGYDKAEKVNITEKEITSEGLYDEDFPTVQNTLEVGKSKVTYVKPEQLNTISGVEKVKVEGMANSIETTSYKLTKPFGQSNYKTSVYGASEALNTLSSFNAVMTAIGDVIKDYLKAKK